MTHPDSNSYHLRSGSGTDPAESSVDRFIRPIVNKLCGALIIFFVALLAARAATTNSISPGQILSGSITTPAQMNCYSFTAKSNDVIYLTLLRTNGPGNYPYFYLYDPDDELLSGPGYNSYE